MAPIRYFWKAFRRALPSLVLVALLALSGLLLPLAGFPDRIERRTAHGLQIALIAAICWALFRAAEVGRDALYDVYDTSAENNIRQRRLRTQIEFIYRIVLIGISIAGLSMVLMTFHQVKQIGASLIASAGVASVVIGFAAQKSLGNLVAGFQIAFTQPLRIDDVVVVEKEFGRIEEITLTYVVVRLWDLRRLVLPITYFVEKPFENWTRTSSEVLGSVMFFVDYRCPVEALRAELQRLVHGHPYWDGKVCALHVIDADQRTMQVRALIGARNAEQAFELRAELREKLIAFLRERHPKALPRLRLEGPGPASPLNSPHVDRESRARDTSSKCSTSARGRDHDPECRASATKV